MSKQKAIGYVRSSVNDSLSLETQRKVVAAYCASAGYDLICYYEASDTSISNQLVKLEHFIRSQLDGDTSVRLIPTTFSRLSKDYESFRSAIIALDDKGIRVEPVDTSERDLVEELVNSVNTFSSAFFSSVFTKENEQSSTAYCTLCGGAGDLTFGCSCKSVEINGKRYSRIPYGRELFGNTDDYCPDCGVLPGMYHHSGCDVEECPACGKRFSDCECELDFILADEEHEENVQSQVNIAAEALLLACEFATSEGTQEKINTFVEEHYAPELSLPENVAFLVAKYLKTKQSSCRTTSTPHSGPVKCTCRRKSEE